MGPEISDSPAAVRSRPWSPGQLQQPEKFALAAAALFVVPWFVFVGDGSQLAYLIALTSATAAAALLGWSRSWLAALLIVAIATIVGTEARGELGRGSSPLSPLRLLDVALLAAGGGLLARYSIDGGARAALRTLIPRPRRISVEAWIVIAVVSWAAVLWIANGTSINSHFRTDMRLILLGAGTYFLAKGVVPGHRGPFTLGMLALAPILALKAALIYMTASVAIGAFDRLQAVSIEVPRRRVLLIGGDTLLILTPALATAIALRTDSRAVRWSCALAATCATGGVLLSGTRTNLLVAAAMVLVTLCLPIRQRRLRITRLSALAAVLIVLATAAGAYATGVAERLVTRDQPHVGLNFRRDEIQSASRLSQRELVLGQGLGGTFISRDAQDARVVTGWSHVLPVWVVLKVGLLGLLALLYALGLLLRRVVRAVREQGYGEAFSGAQLIVGLIVMSLTINRFAQPEGAILLAIGVVLIGANRRGMRPTNGDHQRVRHRASR